MDKSSKTRRIGKALLLSAAVGTLPLAGCAPQITDADDATGSITVSATEADLYRAARDQRNVQAVTAYLQNYPNSQLVSSLLPRVPVATLRQIDRSVVAQIPQATVASLPSNTRAALGAGPTPPRQTVVREDRDDGYS